MSSTRITNPHQIYSFYTTNPWEKYKTCPLYCPTTAALPFQVKQHGVLSGVAYEANIVNPDTSFSQAIQAVDLRRAATATETFFYYRGDILDTELEEGMYQVELNIAGTKYWGYPLCARTLYKNLAPTVTVSGCDSNNGVKPFWYNIPLYISSPDADIEYRIEYDNGTGFTHLGITSGAITDDLLGDTGSISTRIRAWAYFNNEASYSEYMLDFDADAACSNYTLTYVGAGGSGTDRYKRLEWSNTEDLQNMGLYYGNNYKQRFYFEGYDMFSTPISDESFVQNGETGTYLERATVSEQLNIDFYPVPDHAAAVLNNVRYHNTVSLLSVFGNSSTPVDSTTFSFTPSEIEQAACRKGQISFEHNKAFVNGCEEDYTITFDSDMSS